MLIGSLVTICIKKSLGTGPQQILWFVISVFSPIHSGAKHKIIALGK